MILGTIRTEEVANVEHFVRTFDAQDLFKTLFGVPIEYWPDEGNWDADEVYIEQMLEKMEGTYYYYYVSEDNGYFVIIQFNL